MTAEPACEQRFANQTALVTGGTRGIGAATAEWLARGGATVAVTSRCGASAACVKRHSTVRVFKADAANYEEMRAVVAQVCENGGLDICVANAGVLMVEDFLHADPADWVATISTNLIGVLVSFRVAAERMLAGRRGGRLLVTASAAGLRGEANSAVYSATKAGVVAVVQALAVELAPHAITVNGVAPGEINTTLHAQAMTEIGERSGRSAEEVRDELVASAVPLRRLGEPADVAAVLAFLASDAASYITGEVIRVDGGSLLL